MLTSSLLGSQRSAINHPLQGALLGLLSLMVGALRSEPAKSKCLRGPPAPRASGSHLQRVNGACWGHSFWGRSRLLSRGHSSLWQVWECRNKYNSSLICVYVWLVGSTSASKYSFRPAFALPLALLLCQSDQRVLWAGCAACSLLQSPTRCRSLCVRPHLAFLVVFFSTDRGQVVMRARQRLLGGHRGVEGHSKIALRYL